MELITKLISLATKSDMLTVEYNDVDALVSAIETQAENIGKKTGGGKGNWCIVNTVTFDLLKKSPKFEKSETNITETGVKFVGILNDINAYHCVYHGDTTPLLVGYKGKDGEDSNLDACAVFAPYIPLVSSGVTIDPHTYEPIVSFMTRYGFYALEKHDNYLLEASDYLGLIGFADLTELYSNAI